MARSGMQTLIDDLRENGDVGTAEYTVGTTTYYTDDQLQDLLDRRRRVVVRHRAVGATEYSGSDNVVYRRFLTGLTSLEGTASGTAQVRVEDANGNILSGYTLDENSGIITFSADQGSSTNIYFTGWVYDLNGASADLWRIKSGFTAKHFSFAADSQRFQRGQWHNNCIRMERQFRRQQWTSTAHRVRTDI